MSNGSEFDRNEFADAAANVVFTIGLDLFLKSVFRRSGMNIFLLGEVWRETSAR